MMNLNFEQETKNFVNTYTIRNYDHRELALTTQYLACLNKDQVLLHQRKRIEIRKKSYTRLSSINDTLLKLYYLKSFDRFKINNFLCPLIISLLIIDLIQLLAIKDLQTNVKVKSAIFFGVNFFLVEIFE